MLRIFYECKVGKSEVKAGKQEHSKDTCYGVLKTLMTCGFVSVVFRGHL
jgi:hypothetical protein